MGEGRINSAAPASAFLAINQQVFQRFAVLAGILPEAALLGFEQTFEDVLQGAGVVLLDKVAGVFVEQIGIGEQCVLVVINQFAGGVEGEQIVDGWRQLERALVAVGLR